MERPQNDVINLSVEEEIQQLALRLNCPKHLVLYCSHQVGPSIAAIECYWDMNKEWLMKYKGDHRLSEQ